MTRRQWNRFVDDARAAAERIGLDCRSCGACCHGIDGKDGAYMVVEISPEDAIRIESSHPGSVERLDLRRAAARHGFAPEVRPGYRMRFESTGVGDACVFANGIPGRPGCGCRIYDDRPSVCREFPPGNPVCLRMRAVVLPAWGVEPQEGTSAALELRGGLVCTRLEESGGKRAGA